MIPTVFGLDPSGPGPQTPTSGPGLRPGRRAFRSTRVGRTPVRTLSFRVVATPVPRATDAPTGHELPAYRRRARRRRPGRPRLLRRRPAAAAADGPHRPRAGHAPRARAPAGA